MQKNVFNFDAVFVEDATQVNKMNQYYFTKIRKEKTRMLYYWPPLN